MFDLLICIIVNHFYLCKCKMNRSTCYWLQLYIFIMYVSCYYFDVFHISKAMLLHEIGGMNEYVCLYVPIFRSTRLCVTVCGIMHPRCCRPPARNILGALYHSCNTQPSVPEYGQNNSPRRVELTGIINKPLLLHLVGCLYYLYQ